VAAVTVTVEGGDACAGATSIELPTSDAPATSTTAVARRDILLLMRPSPAPVERDRAASQLALGLVAGIAPGLSRTRYPEQ